MSKIAILQVADTGPLESLVVMLRSVGYTCHLPSAELRHVLSRIGCDTVIDPVTLQRDMGYEAPMFLPAAGVADMARTDVLYVDVKAHRNMKHVVKRWLMLEGKVLWYRINGGKPEHVINQRGDMGDEVNPGCPVLTPNLWYMPYGKDGVEEIWSRSAYACYPPFYRFDEHNVPRCNEVLSKRYAAPICLIHNVSGWGYDKLIQPMRELGVQCHGQDSPDGLVHHSEIGVRLSNALCMVHLKSSDAPGYALYEALASACPVVCTRRLIWRNRMEELLIPGETCLAFDRETHDALSTEDVVQCRYDVQTHLRSLRDPKYNRRIGEAGRAKLKQLMWNETRDQASLQEFIQRNFK